MIAPAVTAPHRPRTRPRRGGEPEPEDEANDEGGRHGGSERRIARLGEGGVRAPRRRIHLDLGSTRRFQRCEYPAGFFAALRMTNLFEAASRASGS